RESRLFGREHRQPPRLLVTAELRAPCTNAHEHDGGTISRPLRRRRNARALSAHARPSEPGAPSTPASARSVVGSDLRPEIAPMKRPGADSGPIRATTSAARTRDTVSTPA